LDIVPGAVLIALREGLEALLVLGILCGLVVKLGRPEARRSIFLGAGLAAVASVAVGIAVDRWIRGFFETGGAEAFELIAALVAVVVLTYMVVWMWRHTRGLMATLRRQVSVALAQDKVAVLMLLAFATVLREGLETVLFYGALAGQAAPLDLGVSAIVGFAISGGIAYGIFRGSVRLDLPKFFALTGCFLVLIAGGLLVHSADAAMALGLLPPAEPIWDTSAFLSNDSPGGRVLHALVGYWAAPTLVQALLYFGYVLGLGGWFLASLGLFRVPARSGAAPPQPHRNPRVVAAGLVVLIVSGTVLAGATGTFRGTAPEAMEAATLPPGAKMGLLYRSHGEPPEYNATTYASFARFTREILTMFGQEHLLAVDQGTVLLDRDDPYASSPSPSPRLVNAWLRDQPGPAVFVPDPGELAQAEELRLVGSYYLLPGPGPGLGEPDILEMAGLGAWLEWEKMGGRSPHYETERLVKERALALLRERWPGIEARFGYMVNPYMHPRGELEEAVQDLAASGVTHIVDFYAASVRSDVMDTCMMRPHVDHALEQERFAGPVVRAGMAGHTTAWAEGVAARVQELLVRFPAGADVAVFLSQHGGAPGSRSPCGSGVDQYRANTLREFELARQAVAGSVAWGGRLGVYHVYAQGASEQSDPGGVVLSPAEVLAAAEADGFAYVLDLPYDFVADGFDDLVVLREAYGFTRDEAPYFDAAHETSFTVRGMRVLIASAASGIEAKARAHVEVIDAALRDGLRDGGAAGAGAVRVGVADGRGSAGSTSIGLPVAVARASPPLAARSR
jgi:high-affinity iron transporter